MRTLLLIAIVLVVVGGIYAGVKSAEWMKGVIEVRAARTA